MKQEKRVELLAPAGNKEAFYGAIHAGADAVYLGGNRFGARAYADNFTVEELITCIRYAHLWSRKVYLTVNTLVKESEFDEIYDYLRPVYEAGLDGVIIQDIGVFRYIKAHFPNMELHVSTQMTITGKYGAQLLKNMGACRVVPARELSLDEIVQIKRATGLEIECFIHGAMCYCYSGQCLFSSILGGRSGNRGRCAQPCRLPYRVENNKSSTRECYPLSLKDMCTIEHIPELIASGIDSFKIEGRMKKPEYAAGVTAIYRKYIDNFYQSPEKLFQVSKEDLRKLSCLYIRSERQDGYYHKHNGKDMVTLSQPSYSGSDETLLSDIRSTYLDQTPRLPVSIYGRFVQGENARVTFRLDDLSVTVMGESVQPAQKQPISYENVAKQLQKLGDSIFYAKAIEIHLDNHVFYPLKEINELRRKAVMQLEEQLIIKNGFPVHRCLKEKTKSHKGKTKWLDIPQMINPFVISVRTEEQLEGVSKYCANNPVSRIYLDGDLFAENKEIIQKLRDLTQSCNCGIFITLPYILRSEDEAYLEMLLDAAVNNADIIKGFQVRCLEGFGFLADRKYSGKIFADAGLYVWNKETVYALADKIAGFCLPYELNNKEQNQLIGDRSMENQVSVEKIFYGRIPMMITANCVIRTTECCRKGQKKAEKVQLIDRYQKKFPVLLNCNHCMNIIYNSVPLALYKEREHWQRVHPNVAMRLDFTLENAEETIQILEFFRGAGYADKDVRKKMPYKDYTTGHEKRGVE